MISIITDRLTKYEELKNQPSIYNMCVSMEIHKFIYEEMLKDVPKNLLKEFNDHLLSFHEEMELIYKNALKNSQYLFSYKSSSHHHIKVI